MNLSTAAQQSPDVDDEASRRWWRLASAATQLRRVALQHVEHAMPMPHKVQGLVLRMESFLEAEDNAA
jgi:hypothetical protein